MSTHAIGTGTCNVPVNMLQEEREIIGRLATQAGHSTGDFVRQLLRRALATTHREASEAMIAARRERNRTLKAIVVLAAGLFVVGLEVAGVDSGDMARARVRGGRRRQETEEVAA